MWMYRGHTKERTSVKFYPTDKMNGSNCVDQEGRMMRAVVHREYFEGSVECESKWAHV